MDSQRPQSLQLILKLAGKSPPGRKTHGTPRKAICAETGRAPRQPHPAAGPGHGTACHSSSSWLSGSHVSLSGHAPATAAGGGGQLSFNKNKNPKSPPAVKSRGIVSSRYYNRLFSASVCSREGPRLPSLAAAARGVPREEGQRREMKAAAPAPLGSPSGTSLRLALHTARVRYFSPREGAAGQGSPGTRAKSGSLGSCPRGTPGTRVRRRVS